MDNKFLTTIVLAAAAGVAGALLYNRFLKKPCKCKDNTQPPIVGKGTAITGANLQSNEAALNYIGKMNKKRNMNGSDLNLRGPDLRGPDPTPYTEWPEWANGNVRWCRRSNVWWQPDVCGPWVLSGPPTSRH